MDTKIKGRQRFAQAKTLMLLIGFWILLAFHFGLALNTAPTDPLERARYLMQSHPIADTHNDLPIKLRFMQPNDLNVSSLPPAFHTDIKRMREGGLGIQIWSGYVPCSASDRTKKNDNIMVTLEQIDLIKRMIRLNPEFAWATTVKEIKENYKNKKISSLIGLEGGHQIDDSLAILRQYRELGVIYMTLTHSCPTNWADSATSPAIHNGLTDFGKRVVREMNRVGMMVDIAHVSHNVMRDVIIVSEAPLFASHSSASALCPKERNIPDFVLKALKEKDGVIMINFWTNLITCKDSATIEDVLDHISHISKVAGPQYVGFGADFDGVNSLTKGLEDVSKYPNLVAGLIKRGFTDDEVIGIMSENFLRVLEKTEEAAKRLGGRAPDDTFIDFNRTC